MISTRTLREVAKDLDTTLGAATGRAQVALLLNEAADELDALHGAAVASDEAAVTTTADDTTVAKKPKKK